MAATYAQGLILLLVSASMWAISTGNKDLGNGFNYTYWAHKQSHPRPSYNNTSRKIIVGGSQKWILGFNYSDWALKNGPFYLNDTLVFKYNAPSESNKYPHNVYLLPHLWSYLNCNLSRARLVANESQGVGDGFEFVLKRWQPHYFACAVGNGFHCNSGMKFVVKPLPRRWN